MTKPNPNGASDQDGIRKPSRTSAGRFKEGTSGNPGGRPKSLADIQEIARSRSGEALDVITRIMREGKPLEQLQAARLVLERAWGKPVAPIDSQDGSELVPVINIIMSKSSRGEEGPPSGSKPIDVS